MSQLVCWVTRRMKTSLSLLLPFPKKNSITKESLWLNVANLAVFPRIWACFLVGLRAFLKTCGWLVFGLVSTEICLFFADICFCDWFFFELHGNFMFQFAHKGILGVFLWKYGHFGFVFRICHHVFLFNLLADFSFYCIFLPTHVGLVFRSNYLFSACFFIFFCLFLQNNLASLKKSHFGCSNKASGDERTGLSYFSIQIRF